MKSTSGQGLAHCSFSSKTIVFLCPITEGTIAHGVETPTACGISAVTKGFQIKQRWGEQSVYIPANGQLTKNFLTIKH